jgi:serine/threonine protein kinase
MSQDADIAIALAPARLRSAAAAAAIVPTDRRGRSLVPIAKQELRDRADRSAWSIAVGDPWCTLTRVGYGLRGEGWKLHVAATAASASVVLRRSLPLLLDEGASFKFAGTIEDVMRLNAPNYPREGAGKFITVYPADDVQLVALAEQLHRATEGVPAPAILSDRPYLPGSTVHLRFGAFRGVMVLSNDGEYRAMMAGPGGELVEDRREPRFAPPPWAHLPLADGATASSHPTTTRDGVRAILLGRRFRVTGALRHANKGGIYRAIDELEGGEVIVKEARPHVAGDDRGYDARDVLRREAAALERLAAVGIAPLPLALFEQGGHLFLAQERVPGVTLRRWVSDERSGTHRLRLAIRLAEALESAHVAGVVVRDFTPNNVMVTPDDEVRLIDLELALLEADDFEEDLGRGRLTPGYGAPEQLHGGSPDRSIDAYGLGTTLCYLLSAEDPYFAADDQGGRTRSERLAEWLRSGPRALAVSPPLARLILTLTDEDPARRPSVKHARRRLERITRRPAEPKDGLSEAELAMSSPAHAGPRLQALDDSAWAATVRGTIDHTLAAIDRGGADRLFPSTAFGATTDPCNVQHGAAGILAVLCRASRLVEDPRLPELIATVAHWIERRVDREPSRPPGLYFGAAGIAWGLFDAGRAIDDPGLMDRAAALALDQPCDWPSPDVTHGSSGLGLALLHLWRETGMARLLEHAERCADDIARRTEPGPTWRCPLDFDSALAGKRFHGFAHGTAGVGQFLLDAGLATGRRDLLDLANAAGTALLDSAVDVGDGALAWPSEADGPQTPMVYWCNGSSGVGTFLVRLHSATGEPSYREAAQAAGAAVMRQRWRSGLSYCHGLAGNGDFLLDLAAVSGEEGYRVWAEDLASIIWSKRVLRDGAVTFGDDPNALVADFNVGLGGILAFFLRLRYGGPRIWLVEGPER